MAKFLGYNESRMATSNENEPELFRKCKLQALFASIILDDGITGIEGYENS